MAAGLPLPVPGFAGSVFPWWVAERRLGLEMLVVLGLAVVAVIGVLGLPVVMAAWVVRQFLPRSGPSRRARRARGELPRRTGLPWPVIVFGGLLLAGFGVLTSDVGMRWGFGQSRAALEAAVRRAVPTAYQDPAEERAGWRRIRVPAGGPYVIHDGVRVPGGAVFFPLKWVNTTFVYGDGGGPVWLFVWRPDGREPDIERFDLLSKDPSLRGGRNVDLGGGWWCVRAEWWDT